ncbi:MAG TPA: serine/threonine-protein kinase [Blastocatellia bacterium]|nr:serine/threonine-protein kinase [Blastocatellia bacterium]
MAQDTGRKDATQEFWSSPASGTPAPQELRPGLKLKNRYLIEKELGRGGIGVVYLARDERLHAMPVVIKFLLDTSNQSAWLAKKFLQEAEALTRINHPGVVRVIDKDKTDDGKPFFVMEFIKGKPLRSVMPVSGMDFEYTAELVRQIGQALGAAHREGILHRDLKPENIMLETLSDGQEQIKLIDFGIVKVRTSEEGSTTHLGIIAGSLHYIAPEQLSGQAVSTATDIYSLAIIAYEMVTGRRPFNPDAPSELVVVQQLAEMHRAEDLVRPKQLRPSLSETAQSVILNALSFDPQRRPQDARSFGEELARALTTGSNSFQATVVVPTSPVIAPDSFDIQAQATAANVARETQKNLNETRIGHAESIAPSVATNSSRKWMIILLVLVVALAAALVWATATGKFSRSSPGSESAGAASSPSTTAPERVLTYSITAQKNPKLYPGSKPFQLPGEVIFSPGDRVRFTVSSPQAGYLYVINESPTASGAAPSFNVLFPSTTSNNNSAQLAAGQQIQIPERGDGFIFDTEQGTEKLWLVWSANAVTELEAVKRWANSQDRGEVKDSAEAALLRKFLADHSTSKLDIEKDEDKKQTIVKGKGDVIAKLVNLEHH